MNHTFDVDIAVEYGLNCAIILENLKFWIAKNEANEVNFHDGYYWTYNSVKAFKKLFPYISERQISNALNKLEENGIIITGNYNAVAYDRTKWYAITKKGESIMQKCKMKNVKKVNGSVKKVEPIPDINRDIKPNINKDSKHKYGEYSHVLLTDKQLEKLNSEYGESMTQNLITFLDEYIEMKGYKAKNHYLAIKKWVVDAVKERDLKKGTVRKEQGNDSGRKAATVEKGYVQQLVEQGYTGEFEGF